MSRTFEIFGGDFNNRGGQLMLWAVLRRLRAAEPDVRAALDAEWKSPFAERAGYGLYTLFPSLPRSRPRKAKYIRPVGRLVSKVLDQDRLAGYGLVGSDHAEGLLDIAGYAYGDKWSAAMCDISRARFHNYRRRGRPVILLPQMLGPFEKTENREAFQRMAEEVTRIYARDSVSAQAARAVLSDGALVREAPDLTIEVPVGQLPEGFDATEPYCVVVPNARMLDKAGPEWADHYLDVLKQAIAQLGGQGVRVVVMCHEANRGDADLAESLAEAEGLQWLRDPDPLRLKAVLAGARFVISSRFHAVVSALSSAVPTLTLGWAHKYNALHEDFDCADLYIPAKPDAATMQAHLERLLDAHERDLLSARLAAAKARMLPLLETMWSEVYDALDLSGRPDVDAPTKAVVSH